MTELLVVQHRRHRTAGPDLTIDCRAGGTESAPAGSFTDTEQAVLFFAVPLTPHHERHVVCRQCRADRLSDIPLAALAGLDPDEAAAHLRARVSIVAATLAVAGVVLSPLIVLGLPTAAAAVLMTRRTGGWPHPVGRFGVRLNVAFLVGWLVLAGLGLV